MFLAGIIKNYEEELICDLAEYYSIHDYYSHPPSRVAIFCKGLRQNSRIMSKLADVRSIREDILLTAIYDNLNWLLWTKTKDGQKNRNKPKQLTELMFNKEDYEKEDISSFNTSKDFEIERMKILEKARKGG